MINMGKLLGFASRLPKSINFPFFFLTVLVSIMVYTGINDNRDQNIINREQKNLAYLYILYHSVRSISPAQLD